MLKRTNNDDDVDDNQEKITYFSESLKTSLNSKLFWSLLLSMQLNNSGKLS